MHTRTHAPVTREFKSWYAQQKRHRQTVSVFSFSNNKKKKLERGVGGRSGRGLNFDGFSTLSLARRFSHA